MKYRNWAFTVVLIFLGIASHAQNHDATRQLSHDIFKQLIEINTADSVGNVTTASEAMAQRFRDAGFPESDLHILGPDDRKKNLVVRLRGSGKHKPVLLLGHLDVVEARREDWTTDPFQFVEKDGFYYGRGTQDMKDGDTAMIMALIRMKKEGFVPDRDVILALTAGEESGVANGVEWLLKHHRELLDADFALNHDGGGVLADRGKPQFMTVDASEKLDTDYELTTTNPGGHSSLPRPDNAIYQLADALVRLGRYQFPFELTEVTRAYYERMADITPERAADMRAVLKRPPDMAAVARLSKDPLDNSILHTTCVATQLNGGHASNALPQTAQANINCRIIPGHSPEEIRQQLEKVIADPKIAVRDLGEPGRRAFDPVPLRPDVFQPLQKTVQSIWPGLPVVPDMATGASDSVYTTAAGIPTYCVSGEAVDRDDIRWHGKDERVRADSFNNAVEFFYRYLKALTSQ